MGHQSNLSSSSSSSLADRTVGELVAERPSRSAVFQSFGIDFCSLGGHTLRQACERQNIELQRMIDEFEAEATKETETENPAELPTADLVNYIADRHHRFLDRELPRIRAMSERVALVHGGHTPSLIELYRAFVAMEGELTSHVEKEEEERFPAITSMTRGEKVDDSVAAALQSISQEHDKLSEGLKRIRELTNDFVVPVEACNTYRALFAGLANLDGETQRHLYLEKEVLYPKALAMVENSSAA